MTEKNFQAKMNVNGRKLFVGDICYALRDDIYDDVWGGKQNYQDGVITDGSINYAIAVGTAYGDGCYYDSKGKDYCVDAGVLGVTNMDYLRDNDSTNLGTIVTIPNGVSSDDVLVEVGVTEDGFVMIDIFASGDLCIFSTEIDTAGMWDDDDSDLWGDEPDEDEDEPDNDEDEN